MKCSNKKSHCWSQLCQILRCVWSLLIQKWRCILLILILCMFHNVSLCSLFSLYFCQSSRQDDDTMFLLFSNNIVYWLLCGSQRLQSAGLYLFSFFELLQPHVYCPKQTLCNDKGTNPLSQIYCSFLSKKYVFLKAPDKLTQLKIDFSDEVTVAVIVKSILHCSEVVHFSC